MRDISTRFCIGVYIIILYPELMLCRHLWRWNRQRVKGDFKGEIDGFSLVLRGRSRSVYLWAFVKKRHRLCRLPKLWSIRFHWFFWEGESYGSYCNWRKLLCCSLKERNKYFFLETQRILLALLMTKLLRDTFKGFSNLFTSLSSDNSLSSLL